MVIYPPVVNHGNEKFPVMGHLNWIFISKCEAPKFHWFIIALQNRMFAQLGILHFETTPWFDGSKCFNPDKGSVDHPLLLHFWPTAIVHVTLRCKIYFIKQFVQKSLTYWLPMDHGRRRIFMTFPLPCCFSPHISCAMFTASRGRSAMVHSSSTHQIAGQIAASLRFHPLQPWFSGRFLRP
jgi:hypothetical protein